MFVQWTSLWRTRRRGAPLVVSVGRASSPIAACLRSAAHSPTHPSSSMAASFSPRSTDAVDGQRSRYNIIKMIGVCTPRRVGDSQTAPGGSHHGGFWASHYSQYERCQGLQEAVVKSRMHIPYAQARRLI